MVSQEWEPIVIGPCRVCGWKALTQGALCVDCREVREWSRVNRAFCELLHRAGGHRTPNGSGPARVAA